MPRPTVRQQIEIALARRMMSLPPGVIGRIAGRPIVRDGNVLDAQIQLALVMNRLARRKPTHLETVADARATMEANGVIFSPQPPSGLALVESIELDGIDGHGGPIPARVYRPHGLAAPAPALLFIHGGGFVVGSIDSHDLICRTLATTVPCVVISIGYRLAPEHPFPAAVDDAAAAFRAIARGADRMGLDPARLAVGGDSAGGNLSAEVALETRSDPVRPCLQLLIYPATDMTMSQPSIRSLGEGFFLEKAGMEWYIDRYLPPGQDRRAPRASPLFADHKDLPPAFVMTAGFDPLRDEGAAYAKALREAGNAVEYRCYGGLIHGFLHFAGYVDAARGAFDDARAALARAFAAPTKTAAAAG